MSGYNLFTGYGPINRVTLVWANLVVSPDESFFISHRARLYASPMNGSI